MKRIFIAFSVGILIFTSCTKEATQEQQKTSTEEVKQEAVVEEATTVKVTSVLTGYLAIKDALVATDAAKAGAAALELLPFLSGEDEVIMKLKEDVQTISSARASEAQRAAFETLSENMYNYVKSNELERGTLYRQYCPMAFQNKGAYWLSTSNEIRNPYFGDKMLKCGSVRETLE